MVAMCTNSLAQTAPATGKLSVVVDPAFGGKDHGPLIGERFLSKAFTLEMASNIAEELRRTGIAAHLTRTDDTFVPYDELLLRMGETPIQPHSYVVVAVGEASTTCVHILYPKPASKTSHTNQANLGDVMRAVAEDQYWTDSRTLANAIRTQIKNRSPRTCVELTSRGSYKAGGRVNLLPPLFVAPVVVIEFGKELARALKNDKAAKDVASISSSIASGVLNSIEASAKKLPTGTNKK